MQLDGLLTTGGGITTAALEERVHLQCESLRLLLVITRCGKETCRWMRKSRGEEQDGAQGMRTAASGCITCMFSCVRVQVYCCCHWNLGVDFLCP